MSLTEDDLSQVRDVVVSAIQELVLPRFDEYDRRFDAIERDIRELKEDVRVLKTDMREVKERLSRLDGRIESLEADIKELYAMMKAQKATDSDSKFARLSAEQKVLQMYENFQLLAQELGVTLPH